MNVVSDKGNLDNGMNFTQLPFRKIGALCIWWQCHFGCI